jgi:hemolysin activation/secretion protein
MPTPDRSRNASLMIAQGLDGAGASAEIRSNVAGLSGPGTARLNFTRLALDASQRDRFANQWGGAVSFGAQYSAQSLAASERISFGGPRFGRGYAAGDAAGDPGWGVGLELNRIFKFDGDWLKQVEPYLLFEAARMSNRFGTPMPKKLRSDALGVRFSDARHYSLDIALAKPTGDAAVNNPARRPRLSLMLSYQLAARLGVCAAEGLKNEPQDFDLPESRRSIFSEVPKGSRTVKDRSRTPETATFSSTQLLPR